MPRKIAAVVIAAGVVAACTGSDADRPVATPIASESPAGSTTLPPATTPSGTTTGTTSGTTEPLDQSLGPVAAPARNPATGRPIYFVMTDRFENGDPTNDTAGTEGGPLEHGFDPTDTGFYHGGDLAGLTARLPYIEGLGIGAIWITPPFTNRFVQGDGTIARSSSGYHGYWQIDWDHVDPHLGTEQEMHDLIAAAHALDIDVYFDIVVNHTGDVIQYAEDLYSYVSTSVRPYLDADGVEFDPPAYAGGEVFPELAADTSFPYTPVFDSAADASVKSPDWLNDVTLYHNRGNSTFRDESDTYGDFFGLDDLFTEHPRVVDGMIEMYGNIIERYGIDGFRIDTMKHVNIEFWQQFAPAIRRRAASLGKPDFYLFGEVFSEDPILQSGFTSVGVSSTLDFIVEAGLDRFVAGADGARLAQAFETDDWFNDDDGNASMQVTFFGNHDQGRMGYLLARADPAAGEDSLLARAELINDLLFLTRGTPVVYYGDEQGFVGDGGDQLARHDMFPSITPDYLDDDLIGTDATAADANFDPDHPLYRHISALSELRAQHPTFVTGAQRVYDIDGPVFAFSRVDRDERIEYVVLVNSDESAIVSITLTAATPNSTFVQLRTDQPIEFVSDEAGSMTVEVPPLSTVILRSEQTVPIPDTTPTVRIVRPDDGVVVPTARYRFEAAVGDDRYAEVTFAASIDGAPPVVIAVDDAPPYRVYWNNADLPAGASIDVIATVDDGSGRRRSDVITVTLGDRP